MNINRSVLAVPGMKSKAGCLKTSSEIENDLMFNHNLEWIKSS